MLTRRQSIDEGELLDGSLGANGSPFLAACAGAFARIRISPETS